MQFPQSIQIEVKVPLMHLSTVESFLKQCCDALGDRLLGRRVFQEEDCVLFLVQLTRLSNRDRHMHALQDGRNRGLITSFQFTRGSVIKISSRTLFEQLHDFPLCSGDVFIPGIDDPQGVFLSVQRPLLSAQQSAWLILREDFTWDYLL